MNINQKLHELQGLCWHDWDIKLNSYICSKCGRNVNSCRYTYIPSYTTDERPYWQLLKWCKRQSRFVEFITTYPDYVGLVDTLLDMEKGCAAIAEFDWSEK